MKKHFDFSDSGSMMNITPLTAKARKWIDKNLETEPYQWFGLTLCIDRRYFEDIYDGIEEAFGELV